MIDATNTIVILLTLNCMILARVNYKLGCIAIELSRLRRNKGAEEC